MSTTGITSGLVRKVAGNLKRDDLFVVCDKDVREAFPAVYRFVAWKDQVVGLVRNLKTNQTVYLLTSLNHIDHKLVAERGEHIPLIVIMSSRLIYTLADLRAFNDEMC